MSMPRLHLIVKTCSEFNRAQISMTEYCDNLNIYLQNDA